MPPLKLWFVRAGEGAAHVGDFLSSKLVAIGWSELGPISADVSDDEQGARFSAFYPDEKPGTRRAWQSVVRRFIKDINVGDGVMTYDPDQRLYFLGEIASGLEARKHELSRARTVNWSHQVARDELGVSTRNSLGSIATLFQVAGDARDEVWLKAVPLGVSPTPALPSTDPPSSDAAATSQVLADTMAKASGLIEDRLLALGWDDAQELVAGILRAMGYRARVSPPGADRGVDIFASPDGLGLQEPRIFVEVKHRKAKMDAPEIRSFLGGRRPGDRCLYVSTGGFTKEARYEADRAAIPVQLIDLSRLRELLIDTYDQLAPETRALVPLKAVYWPDD